LNQQNPKGATTTQDYSFLKDSSPIYVTSLSSNNSTVTSAAISTAKISAVQPPVKSPTVKSISNPLCDTVGNHPELHQTNSTSNQLLTTSIIRKPITSTTFDNINNKTVQNNINYLASASSNPSASSLAIKQVAHGTTAAITFTDPSSDLIKHSAILTNNINVLNSVSSQLPNNVDFDPNDGCTSYYSNNIRTEVHAQANNAALPHVSIIDVHIFIFSFYLLMLLITAFNFFLPLLLLICLNLNFYFCSRC
jgi:hypothetical protein